MQVTMKVERPDDVRVTLETTMTVAQWKVLVNSLSRALSNEGGWHRDVQAFRDAAEHAIEKIETNVPGDSIEIQRE
jgi:hypothetical protein